MLGTGGQCTIPSSNIIRRCAACTNDLTNSTINSICHECGRGRTLTYSAAVDFSPDQMRLVHGGGRVESCVDDPSSNQLINKNKNAFGPSACCRDLDINSMTLNTELNLDYYERVSMRQEVFRSF